MSETGILAGASAEIERILELPTGMKCHHPKSWQFLSKAKKDFDGHELVMKILARVEENWHGEKPNSEQNWRWKQNIRDNPRRTSKEIALERKIVLEGAGNWVNQVPVASGLTRVKEGRRAIDLVYRCGNGWYDFVELKVNKRAGTPLFAAMEILQYGVIYIFSRKHSLDLGYEVANNDLLTADGVHLKVLAPAAYVEERDCSWLEKNINRGLSRFLDRSKYKMNFSFEKLPLPR